MVKTTKSYLKDMETNEYFKYRKRKHRSYKIGKTREDNLFKFSVCLILGKT
jgi:hypothetical protein